MPPTAVTIETAEHTGIVVGALLGLAALLRLAYRSIVRPVYDLSVGDKIDTLDARLAAWMEDTSRQIAKLEDQLRAGPDGPPLRDAVAHIESTLGDHIADADQRFDRVLAEVTRANARIDACLMRQSGHTGEGRRATDRVTPTEDERG